MSTVIWHNPRCSKSRETLSLLQARGIEPAVRLYLEEPPTSDELREVLAMLGQPVAALVRVAEAREEGIAGLQGDALIEALAEHPRALQRPVVVHDGRARLGRPPEKVLELF